MRKCGGRDGSAKPAFSATNGQKRSHSRCAKPPIVKVSTSLPGAQGADLSELEIRIVKSSLGGKDQNRRGRNSVRNEKAKTLNAHRGLATSGGAVEKRARGDRCLDQSLLLIGEFWSRWIHVG